MITNVHPPEKKELAAPIMRKLPRRTTRPLAPRHAIRPAGLLAAVIAAGLAPPGARAQTAAPEPAPAAGAKPRVEEVTVTAQKRSESVRKVPVSVTVLGGKAIRAQHITSFSDLTRAVPNLSFSSQAGPGLATLELRGIASDAGTATVALYLDDVSLTTRNLTTQGTAEPRPLDIARVEVLRGPQSTLYGASALGGTVKYVSNQPKLDTFEANVFSELSGTYHGTLNWDEQGVVNIPLIENQLALRLAAETAGDGGYITQIRGRDASVVKDNINSIGYNVVRGTLLWQPADWLRITPSVLWQRTNTRDVDAQYLALPNYQTPKTVAEPGRDDLIVPSLTVNADLGFADLISVSGGYLRTFKRTLDSTIYNNLALYLCNPEQTGIDSCTDADGNVANNAPDGLFAALNRLPSQTFYANTVRNFSQEVRLVSKPYVPGGVPFTWIAGLYYSYEKIVATDTEFVNGTQDAYNRFGLNPDDSTILQIAYPGSFRGDQVYQGLTRYDTANYAAFGEATYYPQPNMRLTAGARYQFSRDNAATSQFLLYSYGNEGNFSRLGHFYAFTPKFAFGWDITPENTAYANVSKGFRLGSQNRPIAFNPADITPACGTPSCDLANLGLNGAPATYGPDKVWNFELGDKFRLFGGRLLVNADIFYILWQDIQQTVPLVTSGVTFQANAGDGTSYGLEWEMVGKVTDDLTLSFAGSVLNATLDNGIQIAGKPVLGTYKGERIPGVPEYNMNIQARQNFRLTDEISGYVSATTAWVGASNGTALGPYTDPETGERVPGNPDYRRPNYATLDLNLGISYGKWDFTLFGRNLTNNNKIIQRPNIQGSASPIYNFEYLGTTLRNNQGFTLRPLTVGMNAAYRF